jgi:hypothetical protein
VYIQYNCVYYCDTCCTNALYQVGVICPYANMSLSLSYLNTHTHTYTHTHTHTRTHTHTHTHLSAHVAKVTKTNKQQARYVYECIKPNSNSVFEHIYIRNMCLLYILYYIYHIPQQRCSRRRTGPGILIITTCYIYRRC